MILYTLVREGVWIIYCYYYWIVDRLMENILLISYKHLLSIYKGITLGLIVFLDEITFLNLYEKKSRKAEICLESPSMY